MHDTGSGPNLGRLPVIAFGADYNPEQWPSHVWDEDVALMKQAGINLVTVAVFSWATIEPEEGQRNFTWLDDIIDLLWSNGISVDLATPIASPPPWMGAQYPETLAQWPNGHRSTWGSRNHFSPASAKYREFCAAITSDMVDRYAQHPAVAMWHVGNEFGQLCYSDESAQRFREWLIARYATLDGLNHAWGTAFWSQKYGTWDHVIPPRETTYLHNPAQELDFKRFSSDLMLEMYLEQVAIIRATSPDAVITTNFMGFFHLIDYHTWAPHIDVISDDIYPDPDDPHAHSTTALTHELMRSLGAGKSWMLMEQAITSVNWRPHNVPKTAQRTRLESLSAVSRGSRGVCFFQWRQSSSGSERFHSALLPHAGPDSDVHQAVRNLGADLKELSAIYSAAPQTENASGSTFDAGVQPSVALVFDWASWWVTGQAALPTDKLDAYTQLKEWHRQLWLRGVRVDVIHPDADLSGYRAVFAPSLHLLNQEQADAFLEFSATGGHLVVGPFSAVADTTNRVYHAPFPAVLQCHSKRDDVPGIGVVGQEWIPLPDSSSVLNLSGQSTQNTQSTQSTQNTKRTQSAQSIQSLQRTQAGTNNSGVFQTGGAHQAHTFVEKLEITGPNTKVHLSIGDLEPDPFVLRGRPVVTQSGTNWYVGALLETETLGEVMQQVLDQAEVTTLPAHLRSDSLDIVQDNQAVYILNYALADARINAAELSAFCGDDLSCYLAQDEQDSLVVGAQDSRIIVKTPNLGRLQGT